MNNWGYSISYHYVILLNSRGMSITIASTHRHEGNTKRRGGRGEREMMDGELLWTCVRLSRSFPDFLCWINRLSRSPQSAYHQSSIRKEYRRWKGKKKERRTFSFTSGEWLSPDSAARLERVAVARSSPCLPIKSYPSLPIPRFLPVLCIGRCSLMCIYQPPFPTFSTALHARILRLWKDSLEKGQGEGGETPCRITPTLKLSIPRRVQCRAAGQLF